MRKTGRIHPQAGRKGRHTRGGASALNIRNRSSKHRKQEAKIKNENSEASNQAQIRARLDDWAKAVRAKDVEAVMSHYASDILLFDLAPPLQYRGADVCRSNWEEWFATFQGPVGYDIGELNITSVDDVAFCHSLNRIHGVRTDGEQTDVWVRATVGLCKLDGRWTITHEHYSVPFYMQPPYKASLDLKP
jgi:ketosteroid isomerase-like protein